MTTAALVAAGVALVVVLVMHLPRRMSRIERVQAEILMLEEHLHDLTEERGETCARLGELRAELSTLMRPAP